MFHWICPECGREIAPQAKECAACDPLAAAAAEAPVAPKPEVLLPAVEAKSVEPKDLKAKSEVKAEPKPAEPKVAEPKVTVPQGKSARESEPPLQPRVTDAPKSPAAAIAVPVATVGRDLAPVESKPAPAQFPAWQRALPEPEPARAPQITSAPLREPQAASLTPLAGQTPELIGAPEAATLTTALPTISSPISGPPLAPLAEYAKVAASRIRPAVGNKKPAASAVKEQISLPGPTLPHELTSLQAAGIAKILVLGEQQVPVPHRSSSWLLSFTVAAAVIAGTLGAAFYAMPGLANSSAPPKQVATAKATKAVDETPEPPAPTNPLERVVEVTGIRFVTDIPGQSPQIHYLVVNHGNLPLMGVTVNVTLRAAAAESDAPVSQFAFRAPRLGPYESKEMVSSIERFNRPVSLPNWRDLRAQVQIAQ